ncbi:MAG: DUF6036 family nucleotidyltransferase [Candidatus Omnitrophota bacterium]
MGRNILKAEIWHKIIDSLNKNKLEYVLVGGTALAVHGIPRSTLDIDIYIIAKAHAVNKLFQIAEALGFKSEHRAILALAHSSRLIANQWVSFSYEGREILDVFLSDEREFKKILENSEIARDKDISIRVAALKDIERMKKNISRPVDIADIALIKEVKKLKPRRRLLRK